VIKDVQTFNEVMMKDMKEKFAYTKKKFYLFNAAAITQCVNNTNMNASHAQETLLFKLKDPRHVLIFSVTSQSFKERTFIDANSTFKSNLTTHTDITQLNLPNNTLYILCGNNQIKNDKYNATSCSFTALPNLNEKRQEFASMQFNNYVYVFFGFSPDKGRNLSSIERIDVEKEDKFDVVYINEQIALSGIACARCVEDDDTDSEEVLILGGFDGKEYVDTTLLFNAKDIRVKDCDVVIPNIKKNGRFLFQRESMFVKVGKDAIGGFDMNNNVYLITKESYELFSEVQG
jgi:hypothetical protein